MTLNDVMALILCNFTEFGDGAHRVKVVEDVVKNSCWLSYLLMSFLLPFIFALLFYY